MSFWLELHCDAELFDQTPNCVGLKHRYPMSSVLLKSSLTSVAKMLECEAIAFGWKKINRAWHCPACRKVKEGTDVKVQQA